MDEGDVPDDNGMVSLSGTLVILLGDVVMFLDVLGKGESSGAVNGQGMLAFI